jgi:hypothetical protein
MSNVLIPFNQIKTLLGQRDTFTVALDQTLLGELRDGSRKLLSRRNVLDVGISDTIGPNSEISYIKLITLWRATTVERGRNNFDR